MRSFVFVILFIWNFTAFGQNSVFPFRAGEQLTYHVAYNWRFVWVDAGRIRFVVDSTTFNQKPAYSFKSIGRSIPAYDWFFKVRDEFRSEASAEDFSPFWYSRKTNEGGYKVDNRVDFDYDKKKLIAKTENSSRPTKVDTLALSSGVLDVLTAVYYARAQDFSKFSPGEKIPLNMVIDGEIHNLYGRYLSDEVVENYDGQLFRCHKFSATLVEGTMFRGGEDLFVWFSADRNRIPILVEAKILVGSVKAWFSGGKNIFHPMDSALD